MKIRSEDIDAIVTAVEMLIEGVLSTVHVRRDDELIFSAYDDGSGLVVDPEVMAPELARHLLEHTALGGDQKPAPSTPTTTSERATRPEANGDRQQERPVRA